MPTETDFDLNELTDTYEVAGELSGRADVRTFVARRRTDSHNVLITVATTPPNDEGNALSHLAADAKSLMATPHENIVPVLDARWVGTDAFAIVMPKLAAPTLSELLARRDEEFDYPRVASILREANAALEWARAQKIVHRAVDPDAVYVEPGSDNVVLCFAVRALPLSDMPGAEEDARTIATLARTMLTRSGAAPERETLPLAELRPGLPQKVIEQTEALSGAVPGVRSPDVSGYIASIAMAEALKAGELEIERMAARWAAEERAMRDEIDRLRKENERIAEEQARQCAHERESIARDRDRMQRECATQQREMQQALARERAEMERALLRDRKALDEERAALAALREELLAQRQLYAQNAQFRSAGGEGDRSEAGPPLPPAEPPRRTLSLPSRPRAPRAKRDISWARPVSAVVALLVVAATLFAFGRKRADDAGTGGVAVSVRAESAAGTISPTRSTAASADSTHAVPPVPLDFVSGVAARAASEPITYRPRPRRAPSPVTSVPVSPAAIPDSSASAANPAGVRPDSFAPRADTLGPAAPPGMTTPTRRDTLLRPRRDSTRRDTLPRDTL